MTNLEISNLFQMIAASYSIKNEQKYRFQIVAYQKAADALKNSPTEAKDLLKDGKLTDIPGIGPSISAHIKELLTTGNVKHFDDILKDIPKAMFPLLAIPTFGPKKAYKLVTAFHLTDPDTVIQDIMRIAKDNKISKLEGFGEKSQADIIQALAEYRTGKGKTKRMELPFAAEIAKKVQEYLEKSSVISKAVPLGSLRRMASTIGDIDFAVATSNPKDAIEHFVSYPYKERIIEKGPMSASLLISGGKQVDLMTMDQKSFGSLLQHFTGSKSHNIHLREYALSKGISLSERGMKRKTKDGKTTIEAFSTEEAFYNALGMDWIPPEMREDTGEIEQAIKHALPKLITVKDIKGDFHIHSDYPIEPSHDLGADSMQIMIDNAKKLDYEYLGFSEHNPSVSKHTKNQMYSLLEKRKDKIEQLKESNKNIRIINLLELDILANGDLAIDEKALECVDAVLVSIHSSFGMSKDAMTKRVLNGLSHPKAKILSHPTGRLINDRNGYQLDFDKIFDFAKKNNKALEINAWPTRLDLPDILVREAVKQGVTLVIDSDSHAVSQMRLMQYGVFVARRGWATKHDILNTLSYNEVIAWFKNERR